MGRHLICPRCRINPRKPHWNAKWCARCANELVKRPRGHLELWQIEMVHKLKGRISWDQIAERIGSSRSNLNRWRRDAGVYARSDAYPTEVVAEVCRYYENHGRPATEKRFPRVRVRSIVERYAHAPRQTRWDPEQLVELVRMAGLVSKRAQARHFNRPRAGAGSIHAAWWKKFGMGGGTINGLNWDIAKEFVRLPAMDHLLEIEFWQVRSKHKQFTKRWRRRVLLWIDVEKYLDPKAPAHIKAAVAAIARFQRWLHGGGTRARSKITRMIQEVEYEGRKV